MSNVQLLKRMHTRKYTTFPIVGEMGTLSYFLTLSAPMWPSPDAHVCHEVLRSPRGHKRAHNIIRLRQHKLSVCKRIFKHWNCNKKVGYIFSNRLWKRMNLYIQNYLTQLRKWIGYLAENLLTLFGKFLIKFTDQE